MEVPKTILIGGLLAVSGITAPMVYDEVQKALPLSEATTIERIENLQRGKQKFEQLSPEQVTERIGKTPYKTEVNEYVGPRGNGYQVVMYKIENEIEYSKAVGYGAEAEDFTYDWKKMSFVNEATGKMCETKKECL